MPDQERGADRGGRSNKRLSTLPGARYLGAHEVRAGI
jgi:hypothetical protein